MKTIDVKSMIIGVLLTTTVIFGMGATGKDDAPAAARGWDDKQKWMTIAIKVGRSDSHLKTLARHGGKGWEDPKWQLGWEPFAVLGGEVLWRKRIK